jgi:chromosomal replication initiator protein
MTVRPLNEFAFKNKKFAVIDGIGNGMVGTMQHSSNDATTPTTPQAWPQIMQLMRERLGDSVFQRWLAPLPASNTADGVTMQVPTRFMRDWIEQHYLDQLRALWQQAGGQGTVCLTIASALSTTTPTVTPAPSVRPKPAATTVFPVAQLAASPMPPAASAPLSFTEQSGGTLDPRFTFDNFVVGRANELAYAAARRVAEQDSPGFNPLFLYGGVGLGKTHLMHAIAWQLRKQHPERRVVYMSAEKFMYQFVRALRFKDTVTFKDQFRSVDVLMIDDVQFISGREHTQEEFFHTFNALVDQNRQVIVSADKSPQDLDKIDERLRSRLGWGLVADIHPTTPELRLHILQSKARQAQCAIPAGVLEFLANRITNNVRELEGALNRIVAHAQLVGRAITPDMTQEVLADLLRSTDRRITIDEIQKRVAEHYNIRLADMHSARRSRVVARPRQVAMYLAKQLTPRSLPEIGRKFGGRDHTTVMHAVRKVEELTAQDQGLRDDVALLRRLIQN